ncbi:MAG: hypothetical protein RL702_131 [Pseudomonadota bacterium]|nr:hypothetical protein [Novosphingobium sp.]
MNLAELIAAVPETEFAGPAFPRRLLGAFRRKSITFCTGLTDERTLVYWFQSRTFTIDLRLSDGAQTPVAERQGWIGDTVWDRAEQRMSWRVARSYQPGNQWPEPASFSFIGNSVLEFAPSGAYVEDWRQQSTCGPLLGLRLIDILDETSRRVLVMDGGLIVAGEHMAFALSRRPEIDDRIAGAASLAAALGQGFVTEREAASCEVSVASGSDAVAHSTQPDRIAAPIVLGGFALGHDGSINLCQTVGGIPCRLRFAVDVCRHTFTFDRQTQATQAARNWMDLEQNHLSRHAAIVN